MSDAFTALLARRLGLLLQSHLDDAPADPGPALQQPAAPSPIAPALLARAHGSPAARQEAQRLYERCLKHFRAALQQHAALDDAGLAAATFVLANLSALHGVQPGADDLARVERQLRGLLARAGWAKAPLRDRQSGFEQFALLGVLVGESAVQARAQGPAAQANLQRSARGYLVRLLGPEAGRLALAPQGLVLERATA